MSLWSFSVKRWQFTLVVFALLIATGLWALSAIPRAEDPSLRFPGSLVIVQYPGADPEDIERLVVDPIEDALSELEDIKRLMQLTRVMKDPKRPPKVRVIWGQASMPMNAKGNENQHSFDFEDFDGVIENVSVKYTMFSAEGAVLRATANIKLKEAALESVGRKKKR